MEKKFTSVHNKKNHLARYDQEEKRMAYVKEHLTILGINPE